MALINLAGALAVYFGRQGVRVNVVSPGPIAFLLSDASSAVTGTNFVVDAGATASLGWNLFGGVEAVLGGLSSAPWRSGSRAS